MTTRPSIATAHPDPLTMALSAYPLPGPTDPPPDPATTLVRSVARDAYADGARAERVRVIAALQGERARALKEAEALAAACQHPDADTDLGKAIGRAAALRDVVAALTASLT